MKDTFAITLSPEEQDIVRQIEFRGLQLKDHEHRRANGELALKLVRALQGREAIPLDG